MFSTWKSGPETNAVQSPSAGLQAGPGGWHPTILYMLGLVVAEMVLVAILSRHLLSR
jgi:hypothetical protein